MDYIAEEDFEQGGGGEWSCLIKMLMIMKSEHKHFAL